MSPTPTLTFSLTPNLTLSLTLSLTPTLTRWALPELSISDVQPSISAPDKPTYADPAEQMAALRELVDSGQLSDDDKREIKKMFAESLGGGDVDEKIREANKNKDQLDPQAREALDLLNKLMV